MASPHGSPVCSINLRKYLATREEVERARHIVRICSPCTGLPGSYLNTVGGKADARPASDDLIEATCLA